MPIMKRCGSCCVGTFQEWKTAFVEKLSSQATFLKSCGGHSMDRTPSATTATAAPKSVRLWRGRGMWLVDPVCGSTTGLMRPGEPYDSILYTSQLSKLKQSREILISSKRELEIDRYGHCDVFQTKDKIATGTCKMNKRQNRDGPRLVGRTVPRTNHAIGCRTMGWMLRPQQPNRSLLPRTCAHDSAPTKFP
jgi:hypothetical protein